MNLKALIEHLRAKRDIVRREEVSYIDHDPIYGPTPREKDIDVIDFDALLDAIDEFAETFK